jgi:N utilization substance protein B
MSAPAGIRHKARIAAMQVLSILIVRNKVLKDDVEEAISTITSEYFLQERESDFFRSLVLGVVKNWSVIDGQIEKYAPKWPVKDLASVDRSVLEIGIFELLYSDTPTPVVINEWVEIAKEFGDKGTAPFVNGVLSKIHTNHREQ